MSITQEEISSQPRMWQQAVDLLGDVADKLPADGERVAIVGCGTSWFIAQAVAAAREAAGRGESDAFTASEMPSDRHYDRVVAISRSGTTTEVVRCLDALGRDAPTVAITAVGDSPVTGAAGEAVVLSFADEASVVQTRFATTALALMRAHLGESLTPAIDDARHALERPLAVEPADFEHFVFLGRGWSVGLAAEAALKFREAGQAWAESYPAMEYRHGPISVAGPESLVWFLGGADDDLLAAVRGTGASVIECRIDAMAELTTIQRAAVALAEAKGLDPDRPRHLTRSVVLG